MDTQGPGDRIEFQVLAQTQAMPGAAIVGTADDRLPHGGDQKGSVTHHGLLLK